MDVISIVSSDSRFSSGYQFLIDNIRVHCCVVSFSQSLLILCWFPQSVAFYLQVIPFPSRFYPIFHLCPILMRKTRKLGNVLLVPYRILESSSSIPSYPPFPKCLHFFGLLLSAHRKHISEVGISKKVSDSELFEADSTKIID